MNKSTIRALLALTAVTVVLGACTTLEPPEVSLVDIALEDVTIFETSGNLTLRLANVNPEPLAVQGGVYHLYLNGSKIGKGLSDEAVEIPRLESVTVDVPLYVSNLSIVRRLFDLRKSEDLTYRVKGKIYAGSSYGQTTLKFDHGGSFDISKMGDFDLPTGDTGDTGEPGGGLQPLSLGDTGGEAESEAPMEEPMEEPAEEPDDAPPPDPPVAGVSG